MRPLHLLFVFLFGTLATAQVADRNEAIGRRAVFAQGKFFLQSSGSLIIYDTTLCTATRESLRILRPNSSNPRGFADKIYPKVIEWTSSNTPIVQGQIGAITVDKNDAIWMFNRGGEVSVFNGVNWSTTRLCQRKPACSKSDDRPHCIRDVIPHGDGIRVATCTHVLDINATDLKPSYVLRLAQTEVFSKFITSETMLIKSAFFRTELNLLTNEIGYHNKFGTSKKSLDTSFKQDRSYYEEQFETAASLESWIESLDGWKVGPLQARTVPNQRLLTMLKLDAIYKLDHVITCGNGNRNLDYIFDVAADKKGHVYLATERGVIVLPNPSPVAVDDTPSRHLLHVYPNPVSTTLSVELPNHIPADAAIEVMSATGAVLIRKPIISSGTIHLDVSGLATGSYVAAIRTTTNTWSAGIVVSR